MVTAKLQLEVNQLDLDFPHVVGQDAIHFQGNAADLLQFRPGCQAHGQNVREVDQWILQLVVFEDKLQHRAG